MQDALADRTSNSPGDAPCPAGVLMTRFTDRMIGENQQVFRATMQRGEFITDAAEQAGARPRS
jgi:hypothetical protein